VFGAFTYLVTSLMFWYLNKMNIFTIGIIIVAEEMGVPNRSIWSTNCFFKELEQLRKDITAFPVLLMSIGTWMNLAQDLIVMHCDQYVMWII
jgi:hypothetical protein